MDSLYFSLTAANSSDRTRTFSSKSLLWKASGDSKFGSNRSTTHVDPVHLLYFLSSFLNPVYCALAKRERCWISLRALNKVSDTLKVKYDGGHTVPAPLQL